MCVREALNWQKKENICTTDALELIFSKTGVGTYINHPNTSNIIKNY